MTTSAQILARSKFRALAIPFSGPIPRKGTRGLDLDLERFTENTAVSPGLYPTIPVLFHHGDDRTLGSTRLGNATLDRKASPDGWWATIEVDEHEPAVQLVRALAHRVPIYVSSQPLGRGVRRNGGEIVAWPLAELTLTPAPSNTHARIEAMP